MNTLIENSSQIIMQTVRQISVGVNNEVTGIFLKAATISNDAGIMELLTQWNRTTNDSDKFDLSEQINSKLNYFFNNSGQVETIIFFFNNNGMYNYKNEPIISEDSIKKMDWYRESLKSKGKVMLYGTLKSFTYNSIHKYVISASISPNNNHGNDINTIYFAFRGNNLESFYTGIKVAKKGQMLIVDDKNKILASNTDEIIGKDIKEIGFDDSKIQNGAHIQVINGEKVLVSSDIIPKTKWKVVNITKYEELTQEVQEAFKIAVFLIVLMLSLFLVFSFVFFREIVIPINKLIKKMKNVEQGSFDEAIEIRRNDELYQLGESFNRMIRQVKRLIIERDINERQRNQAEIEALQSQINPHFMSNTLNSIRLMAMITKTDSIKNMTDALIKLLQASFGKSGKFIEVQEEIENLHSYIYIMKVRYGDKFDILINIDDQVKKYYVLRMILQPIIENSIIHGISEMEEKGVIEVTGYKNGRGIVFEISDNGAGMTPEQIAKLLHEDDGGNLKGFSSIGIKNVNKRIKLNHGNEYGLKIESIKGEYTRITIELPVLLNKEEA